MSFRTVVSARLERRWTDVGGVRVHARLDESTAPAGAPALVCVHGVGVSSRYLIPTAVELAPDFRVYLPDLPGFGRSGKPAHVLDVTGLASALGSWLEANALSEVTLLANSFGCQVVIDLAARRPDLVRALVLVGPTVDPAARSAFGQVRRWLRNAPREPTSLGLVIARDYWECGPLRPIFTYLAALRDPVEEKLPDVAAPTLVLRGARDPIVSQEWVEEIAARLPAGTAATVDGVAHTVNYTAPKALAELTCSFLADAGVAPRPR